MQLGASHFVPTVRKTKDLRYEEHHVLHSDKHSNITQTLQSAIIKQTDKS